MRPKNAHLEWPEASATAVSASTPEESVDVDALVSGALAESSNMNFLGEEVYEPPEIIEDEMEEQ